MEIAMLKRNVIIVTLVLLVLSVVPQNSWPASPEFRLSQGQTVYVPVYSNVFSGPRKLPFQLAAMLSIRSTDMLSSFRITTIDYYNSDGKLVRRHLDKPISLGPLASTYVYLDEKDSGGFGANFIVKWQSERMINVPIIECVMIGASGGQGISFVSPGQEIRDGR